MCKKIVDSIRDTYTTNTSSIIRAKRNGILPLIILSLNNFELNQKILDELISIRSTVELSAIRKNLEKKS